MTKRKSLWMAALSLAAIVTFIAACGSAGTPNPGGAATAATGPAGAQTTAQTSAAPVSGTRVATVGTTPSGSGSANRVPAPTGKKDLVIATGTDITTLDPQLSTAGNDPNVSFTLYDNLLYRDADGKLQPMLATEYKAVNDTTWQFKLRPDVKFHNGDPLTTPISWSAWVTPACRSRP